MEIKIGTAGTASRTVTEKDTALAVKSGSLQVLATPVLSALMGNRRFQKAGIGKLYL